MIGKWVDRMAISLGNHIHKALIVAFSFMNFTSFGLKGYNSMDTNFVTQ